MAATCRPSGRQGYLFLASAVKDCGMTWTTNHNKAADQLAHESANHGVTLAHIRWQLSAVSGYTVSSSSADSVVEVCVLTARCTLVQSAVLRSYVRLSVTLVDCDHIGWNSSKIISPLVSLGCSLFATHMGFRLAPRSMTLNFISLNFQWISPDFADFGRNSS